jgi:hypothetical protein
LGQLQTAQAAQAVAGSKRANIPYHNPFWEIGFRPLEDAEEMAPMERIGMLMEGSACREINHAQSDHSTRTACNLYHKCGTSLAGSQRGRYWIAPLSQPDRRHLFTPRHSEAVDLYGLIRGNCAKDGYPQTRSNDDGF